MSELNHEQLKINKDLLTFKDANGWSGPSKLQ